MNIPKGTSEASLRNLIDSQERRLEDAHKRAEEVEKALLAFAKLLRPYLNIPTIRVE